MGDSKRVFTQRFSSTDVFMLSFYLAIGLKEVSEGVPNGAAYLTWVIGFLMGRLRHA